MCMGEWCKRSWRDPVWSSARRTSMLKPDLQTWISSHACPYCAHSFCDAAPCDLARTGGPRMRCLPPRPECWKFECPSCNQTVVVCTRLGTAWFVGTGTIAKMINPISVNDAIDRLSELAGQEVVLVGSLALDFEGTCITHIPKNECRCRDDETCAFRSSIWITFDLTAINQREQWLGQFDGRHVRVTGVLHAPEKEFGGCGHFSLWPAEITVTAIEKLSAIRAANRS